MEGEEEGRRSDWSSGETSETRKRNGWTTTTTTDGEVEGHYKRGESVGSSGSSLEEVRPIIPDPGLTCCHEVIHLEADIDTSSTDPLRYSTSSQPNSTQTSSVRSGKPTISPLSTGTDWFRESLPIEIRVMTGSVVFGNDATPTLAILGFEQARGTYSAEKVSPSSAFVYLNGLTVFLSRLSLRLVPSMISIRRSISSILFCQNSS